jgi:acyl-homoserine-lactone acylase
MRRIAKLFVVLPAITLAAVDAAIPTLEDYGAPAPGKVRIVRDTFGVPHIVARDHASMFFGVGFAQAEDQLANIARNYLVSEGRGAEFLGQDHLPLDHLVRSLDLPRLAKEGCAKLSPEVRALLSAFSAGINAYIEQNKDAIPNWIEPTEPHDPLGLGLYVNTVFVVGDCRQDLARAGIKLSNWKSATTDRPQWGSNQFAIEPSRSATGAAMLSMDPHLPHQGVLRWYEMHQVGPDINAMGATFFGLPFVALGRTFDTAWCQTVNAPDLGDVFALQINPRQPHQYRDPEGWQSFDITTENYRVASANGMKEISQRVMRSKFGPAMTRKGNVAYTFRIALPPADATIQQGLAILRARNLEQFRAALNYRGLAMFNFVYADRHGDTFYISNGLVPKRDGQISSHNIRPAEKAWADWQGIHPLNDLPQIDNPSCGYLMNTNSGPQNVTETDALNPENFPAYMMAQTMNSRARRLLSLLKGDTSISWEEMLLYATDTQLEAEAPLARLHQLIAGSTDPLVKAAWDALRKWDRRTDLDSRGAVLFFYLMMDKDLVGALDRGEPNNVIAAVQRVSGEVNDRFGSLDVPWQEFSRIRRGKHDIGIAGSGGIGGFVGAALRPTNGPLVDGQRYCRGGSSYGMIVDFSGQTRSVSCLPFGVSEHPASPHFADMLPLYAQRRFKPAWFLPREIAANTESDRTLTANTTQISTNGLPPADTVTICQ